MATIEELLGIQSEMSPMNVPPELARFLFRNAGQGGMPMGGSASTPVTPSQPTPAAADPIMELLNRVQPRPLSTGQKVGLGIADAIESGLAFKYGRPAPDSNLLRAKAMRELEAERQTQARTRQASVLAGRELEQTRQRERQEDIAAGGAAEATRQRERSEDIAREETLIGRARREKLEDEARNRTQSRDDTAEDIRRQFRNDLIISAANVGAIGEDEDASALSDDQLLSAISKRRFDQDKAERGERGALQERERQTESTGIAEGILTDYMLGYPGDDKTPPVKSVEERMAAGESRSKILFEFERQLAPLQLDEATKARLKKELRDMMLEIATRTASPRPVGGFDLPLTLSQMGDRMRGR